MYEDIELELVDSSNLEAVGYDEDKEILVVLFHHGGKHAYHGIPKSIYTQLINAESIGRYFANTIRNNEMYEHFVV